MAITVISELVVGGRELLKALEGYGGKVAAEVGVLRQDHRPTRHEAVDQRLLPHPLSRKPPLQQQQSERNENEGKSNGKGCDLCFVVRERKQIEEKGILNGKGFCFEVVGKRERERESEFVNFGGLKWKLR